MSKLDVLKEMTGGQMAALIHKVGGLEIVQQILQGKVAITVADVIRKFFDKNGRSIPENLEASVCNPNSEYKLAQPEVLVNGCMAASFERVEKFLGDYLGRGMISYPDYQTQVNALVEKLKADEATANLLKGVWLPIVIPQTTFEDYGECLETVFLPGVENSYKDQYPKRTFTNYRKGELVGNVSIVEGSRHDRLVSQIAEAPVVGIYFPNPMQGFSVNAQREFAQTLPESFLLSGGFDTATAMIMYPSVLAESNKTPGYDCAAMQYKAAGQSLGFGASGAWLGFGGEDGLGGACGGFSGGLLFVG